MSSAKLFFSLLLKFPNRKKGQHWERVVVKEKKGSERMGREKGERGLDKTEFLSQLDNEL